MEELGFPSGQEPTDMKRAHLASGAGNMAGLNYYKAALRASVSDLNIVVVAKLLQASFHNYVIFTPSKEDLQAAGFSGSIYSFHSGRDKAGRQHPAASCCKYLGQATAGGALRLAQLRAAGQPKQGRGEGALEAMGAGQMQGGSNHAVAGTVLTSHVAALWEFCRSAFP